MGILQARILEWVGMATLLQRNFLAQDSNWGLLHSRQILYQLSYPYTLTDFIDSLGFSR